MQRNLLISFSILLIGPVFSQDTIRFSIAKDYGLVDYVQNSIANPHQLNSLFEKLFQLKKEKKGTVNILHIGDSHIQADYLTQQVRQNFQREFGNSGRGFVMPLRVAKTNEPHNYISQSESKWESKRMVFPEQPLPIGLGGVTIRSDEDSATLKITLKNFPEYNYGFNKVTAFVLQEPRSFHVMVKDSLHRALAYFGNFSVSPAIHSATVALPYVSNSILFQSIKSMPQQNRVTYFGFNFENGSPGVLYHSMGVNGAKYKHYASADIYAEQIKALEPDLIILALGTNEALDHPYSDPKFTQYIDDVVQKLKSHNPNAEYIISIHPDSFKKKTKRNPGVANIREKLIEYATENKLAYFDLFQAGGGSHSAGQWREAELLRDDGVHFTRAGYELQGNMFYLALMKAYNQYVSNRHQ